MKIDVDGSEVFLSSGGRKHVEGRPFVVFLHGAGFNHYTWLLQGRAIAYDGFNVIAPDMPGHGLSGGEPLASVEEQAAWYLRLLDALGVEKAILVGHSQGGLIALDMYRQAGNRVAAICFIATAAAIPVNEQLISQAKEDRHAAYANMVDWAHGPAAHMHDNTWPGGSHLNFGVHVMELGDPMALAFDLQSCAAYGRGAEIAAGLDVPAMVILATEDKMTPMKFGKKLAQTIPGAVLHVIADSGHTIPTERPREVNALLRQFLSSPETGLAA